MQTWFVVGVLAMSGAIAAAKVRSDELSFELGRYAVAARVYESGQAASDRTQSISGCYQIVADARATGFRDLSGELLGGIEGVRIVRGVRHLDFKLATRNICDRYARARVVAEVAVATSEVIAESERDLRNPRIDLGVQMRRERVDRAARCNAAIDRLVSVGMPRDRRLHGLDIKLGDAKARICDALARKR